MDINDKPALIEPVMNVNDKHNINWTSHDCQQAQH